MEMNSEAVGIQPLPGVVAGLGARALAASEIRRGRAALAETRRPAAAQLPRWLGELGR